MRSINSKLSRLVVVAVGTVALVVGATSVWQETSRYLDSKRETLLAVASAFAAASAGAVARRDQGGVMRAIRGIGNLKDIRYAAAETSGGELLAEIGDGVRLVGDLDLTGDTPVGNPLALLASRSVGLTVPIVQGGEVVGRLHLVGLTSGLYERLLGGLAVVAGSAVIALALGLLVAMRLQRSITRPLGALTRAMQSIRASQSYDTSVDVHSDDEVGVLAESFNGMLGEVRDRDARLVAHRDRLEQDVAERTQDLRLAKEEAEAANAAKSDFLATMSHEIRTPMNGMLVMAELLAGADLPNRERRFAEVIARSGQSLLAIINDILDFSKIEAGRMTLEEIAFSPADVVDTVVTLFAERADAKRLDLAAYLGPGVPEALVGDPVRVTQILSNLVNNALKFAQSGHVLIAVERVAAGLRFSVEDTGIGIPAEKLGTIFSAFSQVDQSTTRRFGGTGLGLSICKRLVGAMGGEIAVASVAGEGSTFSFVLPLAGGEQARLPRPERALRVAVLVEGEATARSLRDSLVGHGFACAPGEGAEALVVDARRLAELGRGKHGRVVALAGMGDPSGAECLRRGLADALIRRPVVQAEWREVLARLADGRPFEAGPAADQTPASEAGPSFRGRRVLVADDTAVNREVACEALARLGIAAEAVEGGAQAVAAVLSRRYDLVLMDGSMPDVDGYEATRRIRAAEAASGAGRTPIVALTAHVVGAAAEAWREAGMDDVLHKPFTVTKLAACLARQLPDELRAADPPRAGGGVGREADDGGGAIAQPHPAPGTLPGGRPSLAGEGSGAPSDLLDSDTLEGLVEMAAASGREGFVARLLGLYETNAPQALLELRDAVGAGEAERVASAAHKLKSMSLNIGASRLARLLAGLEQEAREAQALPTAAELDEAATLLAASVEALRSRLAQPAPARTAA